MKKYFCIILMVIIVFSTLTVNVFAVGDEKNLLSFEKGDFIVNASSENDFSYTADVLTIKKSGTYVITMKKPGTTSGRIKVDPNVTATITIEDVNIDLYDPRFIPSMTPGVMNDDGVGRPFDMKGATVTLILEGSNSFKAADGRTALFCPAGSNLVIEGTGSLTAETGSYYCVAAIGGEGVLDSDYDTQIAYGKAMYKNDTYGYEKFVEQLQGLRQWDSQGDNGKCGSVTIKSGTVNANALVGYHYEESWSVGSFSGKDEWYEAKIIMDGGGQVKITEDNTAVAIGGAGGGPIRIEGGTVNAKATTRSTVIGSVKNEFEEIRITGDSVVNAQNGYMVQATGSIAMTDTGTDAVYGPAIGWASYSLQGDSSTKIIIDGNAQVTAKSTYGGAGIGGGRNGSGGYIEIGGSAIVDATGGMKAAGIGGGIAHNPNTSGVLMGTGTIIIKDDAQVTAKGGDDAAGIGGGAVRNGVTVSGRPIPYYPSEGQAGTIIIEGNATVNATGGKNGAGIGSGGSDTGNDAHTSSQIQNLIITTSGIIKAQGGAIDGGGRAANIGIGHLKDLNGSENNNDGTRVTGVYVNTNATQSNSPAMGNVPNSIVRNSNGDLIVNGTVDLTAATIKNPVETATYSDKTPVAKADLPNNLRTYAGEISKAIKEYLDNIPNALIKPDPKVPTGDTPSLTIDDSVFISPDKVQGVMLNGNGSTVDTYTLNTSVDGGNGTISPSKNGITENTVETVTFKPDNGYVIDTVTVNGVEFVVQGNALSITMDSDKTVVVTYKAVTQPPETERFTVSFEMNNHGKAIEPQMVNKGAKATEPPKPVDKEYTFVGWFADEGLKERFDFGRDITQDTKIYAMWEKTPQPEGPDTGDVSNLPLLMSLMLVSGGAFLGGLVYFQKRRYR